MPRTVEINPSHTPSQLRRLAASSKDANQSRRLLSIAAVLDGMSPAHAAKIGGMGPADAAGLGAPLQRAWPDRAKGQPPPGEPQAAFGCAAGGTCRDRGSRSEPRRRRRGACVDLQHVIEERFGVAYHERTIGKLLKALGFSHISARPPHPKQDGEVIQVFKNTSRARSLPTSRA